MASPGWGAVAALRICTCLLLGDFRSLSPPNSHPGGSRAQLGPTGLSHPEDALTAERALGREEWAAYTGHRAWSWHIPQLSTGLWLLCLLRLSQMQQHLMGPGQALGHSGRAMAQGRCNVQGCCCSTGQRRTRYNQLQRHQQAGPARPEVMSAI